MNTKNHSYFRQQVHQIEIDDSDFDFFVAKKDEFPLSFSIICHVIEFISNRIEDEKEKSTEENPPLTPPENEDEDPKDGFRIDAAIWSNQIGRCGFQLIGEPDLNIDLKTFLR